MRLSKLTLCGFKSFADKTVIKFDQPVTGIVGPNGCGKSNVVDAVKWVLGSLSPKSLRGDAMMDMIFNGSSTRKPAGMASVSLTFENPADEAGQRKLPIDFDEVSVTRQLFRDGSSEYLINGKRARLRDIRELFMDTGIGTDAYSIIEQGKVARMLESNAAQRREIFEEAAGISRFKSRKKEAQRKLERTEQQLNLSRSRLDDLQRRLRSVKIQAGRARSYKELSQRLRELQLQYALAEFHKLQQRTNDLAEQIEQSEADHAAASRKLAEAEQQLADAQLEQQSVEQQQKRIEHDRLKKQSQKDQAEQRKQFGESALEELEKQIDRDASRLNELAHRGEQLEAELAQQSEEAERLSTEHADGEQQLQAAQDEYRHVQHDLNEKRNTLEDEKAGIVTLMRRTSQLNNEISSIEVFQENLHGTREKLGKRATELSVELERLLTLRDEAESKHDEAVSLIDAQQGKLDELNSQAAELDDQHRLLAESLASAKEVRSGLESRRDLLQEMQDKQEGVADAVKAVLARKAAAEHDIDTDTDNSSASNEPVHANNTFRFVRGLLAEMFETDVEHAAIVEAALGEHQQSLIIDRLSDIANHNGGTEALAALAGRVTFLAIDQCNLGSFNGSTQRSHAGQPLQYAIDLVRYPEAIGPIAWQLLGRTVVVDDLVQAKSLRAALPDGHRFVTRKGELLEIDGRVTAGPVNAASAGGLISRRSELTQLHANLEELEDQINRDQEHLAQLDDKASHIEKVSQELRQRIYEANTVRVEMSSRLENLNEQIASLEREQPVLAAETEQIHRQLRDAQQKREHHQTEAEKLEQDSTAKQEAVDALQAAIMLLNKQAGDAQERVTGLRVDLGKIAEQLSSAQRQVRQIEIASADVLRQRKVIDEQMSQHQQRVQEHADTVDKAKTVMLQAGAELDQLDAALAEVEERLTASRQTVEAIRDSLAGFQETVTVAEQSIHQLQIHRREVEVKVENLCERAREQYDMDVIEAYAQATAPVIEIAEESTAIETDESDEAGEADAENVNADAEVAAESESEEAAQVEDAEAEQAAASIDFESIDWAAVETEIAEHRKKLERLGNVNLDAIDEQDEIEDQYNELDVQVTDIEVGKQKLEQLIKQINHDSRVRFEKTFEQIRNNFAGQNGLFRKLFGGGRADVFLQPDEDGNIDVLDSGIEIIAKPPGKEPQSISLLSGGEKTMTAVALLLSIFQSRPSPFAILDEVDAALDDANVGRFSAIIKSFLDQSHFIVITHHKGTMQSCDVLYGITMQERGVSKRVAVQFDQIDSSGKISDEAVKAQDQQDAAESTAKTNVETNAESPLPPEPVVVATQDSLQPPSKSTPDNGDADDATDENASAKTGRKKRRKREAELVESSAGGDSQSE